MEANRLAGTGDHEEVVVTRGVPDADERSPVTLPEAEPAGDADLLDDLGVPAGRLLELCAQEGMLPADITAELCQAIGCGDEVEELREA